MSLFPFQWVVENTTPGVFVPGQRTHGTQLMRSVYYYRERPVVINIPASDRLYNQRTGHCAKVTRPFPSFEGGHGVWDRYREHVHLRSWRGAWRVALTGDCV